MLSGFERRSEKRLRYNWPVWFAEDYDEILTQGQMVDVSSGGAAFTCYADKCPDPGQEITARFSVPHYETADSFNMESFICKGHICRIDQIDTFVRRIAVQFADPLPFKPAEVLDNELDVDVETDNSNENPAMEAISKTEAAAMAETETTEPIENISVQ